MNLLVVGASGYIGQRLYFAAMAANSANPRPAAVRGTATRGKGDLLALDLATPDLFDFAHVGPDTVVLLTAAISSPDICAKEYQRAFVVNVAGSIAFISRCVERGARVIFFSSDTVYGERADAFDESAACQPVGQYGKMKHQVEQHFAAEPAFKSVRLSYVFSKDDKFSLFLQSCAGAGRVADVFDSLARSVVYRDDVVDAVLALAERWQAFPHGVINFGGPQLLTRAAMARQLQQAAWPTLQLALAEPAADFFANRPRVIAMQSPLLPALLGRAARSVLDVAAHEFSSESIPDHS